MQSTGVHKMERELSNITSIIAAVPNAPLWHCRSLGRMVAP